MLNEYKDMMTVGEVSVALRICPGKAYVLLNDGEIKGFRCKKSWCVPKQSVIDYINKQMQNETPEEKQ